MHIRSPYSRRSHFRLNVTHMKDTTTRPQPVTTRAVRGGGWLGSYGGDDSTCDISRASTPEHLPAAAVDHLTRSHHIRVNTRAPQLNPGATLHHR